MVGEKDLRLLAGAAHLIQDSYVPDHGYFMREYFGKIWVPFAPSWLGTTEEEVSKAVARGEEFSLEREVERFVRSEPSEDLETLKSWAKTRGACAFLFCSVSFPQGVEDGVKINNNYSSPEDIEI